MLKEMYIKLFQFNEAKKRYHKITPLIQKFIDEGNGIEEILATFYKNSKPIYRDEEGLIIVLSIIEEQILNIRKSNSNLDYSKEEIDFHLEYFNKINYFITMKADIESHNFYKTLKKRVDEAVEIINHSKITTTVQVLQAKLNQKSLLLLDAPEENNEEVDKPKDKIKHISKMTKQVKVNVILNYNLYEVEDFMNFISKIEEKGFFEKLEFDYVYNKATKIYKDYLFVTKRKHTDNLIYAYEHEKSDSLKYLLKVKNKEQYNNAILEIVQENNISDIELRMYKKLLNGEKVFDSKIPLEDFQKEQVLTDRERDQFGFKLLKNMIDRTEIKLYQVVRMASHLLPGMFKPATLLNAMLGEFNEVESIFYKNGLLSYRFELENQSFSPISRINYTIIKYRKEFFSEEDVEKFEDWIFGVIKIGTEKNVSDQETAEESSFFKNYLEYRIKKDDLTDEEFYYLFTQNTVKAFSRAENYKEFVFDFYFYGINKFKTPIEFKHFLKVFRYIDKSGRSLQIIKEAYIEEYNFLINDLRESVQEGLYNTVEEAYVGLLSS